MIDLKEVRAMDLTLVDGHCKSKLEFVTTDNKKDLESRPIDQLSENLRSSQKDDNNNNNNNKTISELTNEQREGFQVNEESERKAPSPPPANGVAQLDLAQMSPHHLEQQHTDKDNTLDLILDPSKVLSAPNCVVFAQNTQLNKNHDPRLAKFTSTSQQSFEIKASRKRYFILFMFFVLQFVKSFQWICLGSITNVAAKFYQVDNLAINWTTILFMVTFLILALPVSCIIDSIGLRRSVLIGTLGVTLGVCVKCFSCHRDGFSTSMWGHLIVGISEPFFFSSYSQLASIWFPDNQVALATAVSLIGEQTGLALGFIIPPWVIGHDPNDFAAIQRGLFNLFAVVALISILNTISIVLFFGEEPRLAPGVARFKQKQDETIRRQSLELILERKKQKQRRRRSSSAMSRRVSLSVSEQVKLSAKFMSNKHFLLLLAGFGICQGICYSMHTLLNQMIVQTEPSSAQLAQELLPLVGAPEDIVNHSTSRASALLLTLQQETSNWSGGEDANQVVGNAGLILIVSGLFGSALCGFVLDKYHKHKLTTVAIYLLALLSMAALFGCLVLENALVFYLASIPLGFAQTGYASCAFDYGVELTYPKPELLSSTLLNISAQLFGIPISLVGSVIVDTYGSLALGAFFCLCLSIGFLITCLQGGELRRRNAVNERLADVNLPSQQQQQQQQQVNGKPPAVNMSDKLGSWQAHQKTVL